MLTCNQSAMRNNQKTARKRIWRAFTFGSRLCILQVS